MPPVDLLHSVKGLDVHHVVAGLVVQLGHVVEDRGLPQPVLVLAVDGQGPAVVVLGGVAGMRQGHQVSHSGVVEGQHALPQGPLLHGVDGLAAGLQVFCGFPVAALQGLHEGLAHKGPDPEPGRGGEGQQLVEGLERLGVPALHVQVLPHLRQHRGSEPLVGQLQRLLQEALPLLHPPGAGVQPAQLPQRGRPAGGRLPLRDAGEVGLQPPDRLPARHVADGPHGRFVGHGGRPGLLPGLQVVEGYPAGEGVVAGLHAPGEPARDPAMVDHAQVAADPVPKQLAGRVVAEPVEWRSGGGIIRLCKQSRPHRRLQPGGQLHGGLSGDRLQQLQAEVALGEGGHLQELAGLAAALVQAPLDYLREGLGKPYPLRHGVVPAAVVQVDLAAADHAGEYLPQEQGVAAAAPVELAHQLLGDPGVAEGEQDEAAGVAAGQSLQRHPLHRRLGIQVRYPVAAAASGPRVIAGEDHHQPAVCKGSRAVQQEVQVGLRHHLNVLVDQHQAGFCRQLAENARYVLEDPVPGPLLPEEAAVLAGGGVQHGQKLQQGRVEGLDPGAELTQLRGLQQLQRPAYGTHGDGVGMGPCGAGGGGAENGGSPELGVMLQLRQQPGLAQPLFPGNQGDPEAPLQALPKQAPQAAQLRAAAHEMPEADLGAGGGLHLRAVEVDPVLPGVLGRQKRSVRPFHHLVQAGLVLAAAGDSGRYGQLQRLVETAPADLVPEAVAEVQGPRGARVRHDDGYLVAPVPDGRIRAPDLAADDAAEVPQRGVPGAVAEDVVEELEAVHIHHDHRPARPCGPGPEGLGRAVHVVSGKQSGEVVLRRLRLPGHAAAPGGRGAATRRAAIPRAG